MQSVVRPFALVSVLAILVPAVTASATSVDPYLGNWKLNVAKSSFKPGPAPQSSMVTFEAAGEAMKVSVKSVGSDGAPMEMSYTAGADGKESPVTGSPDYDAVSMKTVNANQRETVRMKGGKIVQTAAGVVSKDGKVLTVTTKGTNGKGQKINNVAVYDKQ
jgi:hypothetical protein